MTKPVNSGFFLFLPLKSVIIFREEKEVLHMKSGKLSTEQLNEKIFKNLSVKRDDILIGPGVGEDVAAIEFGDMACVVSTDPITGTAMEVGRLAVHISCNDIASSGFAPMALLMTIMAPEGTGAEDIERIMIQANGEAAKLGVQIIGGHTEITTAVNRILVSTTAFGKGDKNKIITSSGAQVGDRIYVTKSPGIEGVGIIAYEKEDELKSILSSSELKQAKALLDQISVVDEGLIGGVIGVNAMHDVTEGGILGAIHEMCDGAGVGCIIEKSSIVIPDIVQKVCSFYDLDPLRLISSGAMMIVVPKEKEAVLCEALNQKNISYTFVGVISESDIMMREDGDLSLVDPPLSDELYKIIK